MKKIANNISPLQGYRHLVCIGVTDIPCLKAFFIFKSRSEEISVTGNTLLYSKSRRDVTSEATDILCLTVANISPLRGYRHLVCIGVTDIPCLKAFFIFKSRRDITSVTEHIPLYSQSRTDVTSEATDILCLTVANISPLRGYRHLVCIGVTDIPCLKVSFIFKSRREEISVTGNTLLYSLSRRDVTSEANDISCLTVDNISPLRGYRYLVCIGVTDIPCLKAFFIFKSRRDVTSVTEHIPLYSQSRRDVTSVTEHIPLYPQSRRDVTSEATDISCLAVANISLLRSYRYLVCIGVTDIPCLKAFFIFKSSSEEISVTGNTLLYSQS